MSTLIVTGPLTRWIMPVDLISVRIFQLLIVITCFLKKVCSNLFGSSCRSVPLSLTVSCIIFPWGTALCELLNESLICTRWIFWPCFWCSWLLQTLILYFCRIFLKTFSMVSPTPFLSALPFVVASHSSWIWYWISYESHNPPIRFIFWVFLSFCSFKTSQGYQVN